MKTKPADKTKAHTRRKSAIRHPPSALTYAAGGILWRKTKKGREVLLILRPRYNDWTLPKGHIEKSDDGWDNAALREIKEETGYDAKITSFAGVITYEVNRKPKVVLFWHMKPVGKQNFEVSEEVIETRWFPFAQAIEQLTYEKDKELLRQFA
jgi:8-oxo-dGTP diphosphatase